MPNEIAPGVLSWASELRRADARAGGTDRPTSHPCRTDRADADAHLGMGATIGSVIPTETAVIPSAVGVDIGCGMAAREAGRSAGGSAADDRARRMGRADAGTPFPPIGRWHGDDVVRCACLARRSSDARRARPGAGGRAARHAGVGQPFRGARARPAGVDLDPPALRIPRGRQQAREPAHEGRRGGSTRGLGTPLRTPSWRGSSAARPSSTPTSATSGGRSPTRGRTVRLLLVASHRQLEAELGREVAATDEVNCHHNYTELEEFDGRMLWITRKGAIRPGLVRPRVGRPEPAALQPPPVLGNEASYRSSSHGAGRRDEAVRRLARPCRSRRSKRRWRGVRGRPQTRSRCSTSTAMPTSASIR